MSDDEIEIVKGKSPFEPPLVWAPHTPLLPLECQYNALEIQKRAAIWGAIDQLMPNPICKLIEIEYVPPLMHRTHEAVQLYKGLWWLISQLTGWK